MLWTSLDDEWKSAKRNEKSFVLEFFCNAVQSCRTKISILQLIGTCYLVKNFIEWNETAFDQKKKETSLPQEYIIAQFKT